MNPAERYILEREQPYQEILLYLQAFIEGTLPNLHLRYKYKIPFYYLNGKPFCYFNASYKKKFVDIGFWKGKEIKIHQDHQVTENRKQMMSLRYKSLEEIDENVLIDVLQFAAKLYK